MKLLVVEDEALLRHHLQTRLTESGHVVEAVANAEEALYQTEQFNHDLAMIDQGQAPAQCRHEPTPRPACLLHAAARRLALASHAACQYLAKHRLYPCPAGRR